MNGSDPEFRGLRQELAGLAASAATAEERAAAILQLLGRILSFDAGWLALRNPERHLHLPLATTGAVAPLRDYFARADSEEEVDRLGLNRHRPPLLASEIPGSLADIHAWADHLLPAGFRQGLAAGLFTAEGRHVGFLSLLSADPGRPNPADRRVVAAVTTVIADGLDRTRDIAETARIVESASAGVILTQAGDVLPLPGLPDDRLLVPGSAILTVAADELARGGACISFLSPASGGAEDEQLIRVVALDCARPDLDHLCAAVLLRPPGDLLGLSAADLRVLGLLVEGGFDILALSRALHVTGRTMAASLERSMIALRAGDLTTAAVRAVRTGLRIPPSVTAAS